MVGLTKSRMLAGLGWGFLSCAVTLSGAASAKTRLFEPIHDSQSLIIENNNLTAADFYAAYLSKQVQQRRYAEMYLLGVMDASEGIDWCSYRTVKTITVDEAIFTGLKRLDPGKMKLRAATVIREILADKFGCGVRR